MDVELHWSDVGFAASLMALSPLLGLLARRWRRRRPATRTRRSRTHWEWLPFMFGASVATADLPRVLGASDAVTSIVDTCGHVLAKTTVLILVRALRGRTPRHHPLTAASRRSRRRTSRPRPGTSQVAGAAPGVLGRPIGGRTAVQCCREGGEGR